MRRQKPIKRSTLVGSWQVNRVSDDFHTLIEFANTLWCLTLLSRTLHVKRDIRGERVGGRGEKMEPALPSSCDYTK